MCSKTAWKVELLILLGAINHESGPGALLEEMVMVLEQLVNRGDNPEIIIRQASVRAYGSSIIFVLSGERLGQPAQDNSSGNVHVKRVPGQVEGGAEGDGLSCRAWRERALE